MSTPGGPPGRLTVPADPEGVAAVHDALVAFWAEAPEVAGELRQRFESAVVEVANNVAAHARPGPGRTAVSLRLALGRRGSRVEATLRDDAQPADVATDRSMPGWDVETGRGLALVALLADEVRHEAGPEGNTWFVACQQRDGEPVSDAAP